MVKKLKESVPDFKFGGYKNLVAECQKSQPSSEELLKLLDNNDKKRDRKFYWMIMFAPFCVALAFGAVLWLLQGKNSYDDSYGVIKPSPQVLDSINHESNGETQEKINSTKRKENKTIGAPLSQQQLHENAKEMAKELDKIIHPLYAELNLGLDSLKIITEDPNLSSDSLLARAREFSDREDEYKEETFAILHDIYPGITEREAWRVLSYSKEYTEYNKRANAALKELGQEIERRRQEMSLPSGL